MALARVQGTGVGVGSGAGVGVDVGRGIGAEVGVGRSVGVRVGARVGGGSSVRVGAGIEVSAGTWVGIGVVCRTVWFAHIARRATNSKAMIDGPHFVMSFSIETYPLLGSAMGSLYRAKHPSRSSHSIIPQFCRVCHLSDARE